MPFKLRYSGIESCGVKIKYMDVCEPKLYKKNFFFNWHCVDVQFYVIVLKWESVFFPLEIQAPFPKETT